MRTAHDFPFLFVCYLGGVDELKGGRLLAGRLLEQRGLRPLRRVLGDGLADRAAVGLGLLVALLGTLEHGDELLVRELPNSAGLLLLALELEELPLRLARDADHPNNGDVQLILGQHGFFLFQNRFWQA